MPTKNKVLTKPTKRQCRYKFNDAELLVIGKELAEHNEQLSALEEDKKRVTSDFTARLAGKEADVSIAVNKIQSGYEWRELPCTITFNEPKVGRKLIHRDDTGELVATEDMTKDELQDDLKLDDQKVVTILAVDPGPTESALVEWDGAKVGIRLMFENNELRLNLKHWRINEDRPYALAVEMIASYGMPVGKEVFETCLQIGRFQQFAAEYDIAFRLVYRLQVKQHLCHDSRAKDSNIRQVLLDRFGKQGTKKAPGVLHGIHSHLWAALAVAVYAHDNPEP